MPNNSDQAAIRTAGKSKPYFGGLAVVDTRS